MTSGSGVSTPHGVETPNHCELVLQRGAGQQQLVVDDEILSRADSLRLQNASVAIFVHVHDVVVAAGHTSQLQRIARRQDMIAQLVRPPGLRAAW